jgi:hypothetical protein
MEKAAKEESGVGELCQGLYAGIIIVDEDVDKEKKGILEVLEGKLVRQSQEVAVITFPWWVG